MQCKICNNTENNQKLIINEMMFGTKEGFNYFRCNQCNCIQIEQIPYNLGDYYPSDYYSYQSDDKNLKPKISNKIMFDFYTGYKRTLLGKILRKKHPSSTFHSWFRKLETNNRNTKILDVGCGGGELLKELYKAGFKDCTGIDPFNKTDFYINKSLKILKQDLLSHTGSYDLIMLHHSLEHMPNQQQIIEKIAQLLNANGKVLIRIPIVSDYLMNQFGTNVVSLDAPRHLYIHSINSIEKLLKDNGFTIESKVYDAKPFSFMASEQYAKGIGMFNNRVSYYVNNQSTLFTPEKIKSYQEEIKILNQKELSDSVCLYIKKTL